MRRIDHIVFHNSGAIPTKIKQEFIKLWDSLKHPSFEEFCEYANRSGDPAWFINLDDLKAHYESYIMGVVGRRYPSNLRYNPTVELNKIADIANSMIDFDNITMKANENTLYYVNDYIKGLLIDEQGTLTTKYHNAVELDSKTIDKLLDLLVDEEAGMMHRCMSVYRDAIIIDGNIYNICLSCGDYYINEKRICIFTYDKIKELLAPFKNQ